MNIEKVRENMGRKNDYLASYACKDKDAYRFLGLLEKGGLSATLRRRMGSDIDGACGQLRQRYLEEKCDEGSNL